MAPGPKYRHLSRKSSHRVAMLRNMVTSLIEHERIETTWPKAKEAQRIADKLITLAKKNTEATRRRAMQIFFRPHEMVPKLFGPIRERYLTRPGGYTRVLRIEPTATDQAPSAILELVGNPRDMRRAATALTLARMRRDEIPINEFTNLNVQKVTRFDPNGEEKLEKMVEHFARIDMVKKLYDQDERKLPRKEWKGYGPSKHEKREYYKKLKDEDEKEGKKEKQRY